MKRLKCWFKDHFRNELIREMVSEYNGVIRVVKVFDRPRLMIGGMIQSGGMVRKIWSKVIGDLKDEGKKINEVLILGLGCGDCAFEIRKFYPKVKMVGVEIDKQVVEAAKCFFNLASIKNLKITVADGIEYVKKLMEQKKKMKFDLIIVDIYLGKKMPKPFKNKKLYLNLKQLLNKNGVVAINHLFFGKHKVQAKEFISKLDKVFGKIVLKRTVSNLVILGYK